MRVRVSEGDLAMCALQGVDLRHFVRLLETRDTVGRDAETGEAKPNPFDEVHLATTWGLVVFTFYAPSGSITKALNLDLLFITREPVISNDGLFIDRYDSIVDELLLQAKDQLLTGKKLPVVKPGKPSKPYEVRSTSEPEAPRASSYEVKA